MRDGPLLVFWTVQFDIWPSSFSRLTHSVEPPWAMDHSHNTWPKHKVNGPCLSWTIHWSYTFSKPLDFHEPFTFKDRVLSQPIVKRVQSWLKDSILKFSSSFINWQPVFYLFHHQFWDLLHTQYLSKSRRWIPASVNPFLYAFYGQRLRKRCNSIFIHEYIRELMAQKIWVIWINTMSFNMSLTYDETLICGWLTDYIKI